MSVIIRLSTPALIVFTASLYLSGCTNDRSGKMDRVLDKFQGGDVVQQVESAYDEASGTSSPLPATPVAEVGLISPSLNTAVVPPWSAQSGCVVSNISVPPEDAEEAQWELALKAVNYCLRPLMEESRSWWDATEFKIWFETRETFSDFLASGLKQFFTLNPLDAGELFASISKSTRLRTQFSDDDLSELEAISMRRMAALVQAETDIFPLVKQYRPIFEHFAPVVDRYAVLLALLDTQGDWEGTKTLDAICNATRIQSCYFEEKSLLHPFALAGVIPEEGRDLLQLNRASETPFALAIKARLTFSKFMDHAQKVQKQYKLVRELDNPGYLSNLPEVSEDKKIRVAFIDTGVDFVRFPELSHFLETGANTSRDFADGDENPWISANTRKEFVHGSGTVSTLLTIMSYFNPQKILDQSIRLAVWKTSSIRDLLNGDVFISGFWRSRNAYQDAIISKTDNWGQYPPRIVSMSIGGAVAEYMNKFGKEQNLAKAPWLWVMAAGNEGRDISDAEIPPCFEDFSAQLRPDTKIVCVGALKKGDDGKPDLIADYSNTGTRVELYTYDHYSGICPGGTSCSTPVITAAAAVLASRFPSLSSVELKSVLLEASEMRDLATESGDPNDKHKVRVFDPMVHIDRALVIAEKRLQPK